MIQLSNMIIIGGSSRNVGKTTVCLELISRYADELNITGLKVTSVRPGEEMQHGNHDTVSDENNFRIFEEHQPYGSKDTSKMLKAGAKKAVYIETKDEYLPQAIARFMELYGSTGPIISESRSLRKHVIPSLFILLKHYNPNLIKPDFSTYEQLADLTIEIRPEIKSSAATASLIRWNQDHWSLIK